MCPPPTECAGGLQTQRAQRTRLLLVVCVPEPAARGVVPTSCRPKLVRNAASRAPAQHHGTEPGNSRDCVRFACTFKFQKRQPRKQLGIPFESAAMLSWGFTLEWGQVHSWSAPTSELLVGSDGFLFFHALPSNDRNWSSSRNRQVTLESPTADGLKTARA